MTATVTVDPTGRAHHERPVHETVLFLETDADRGLTREEAARRLERFGPNVLPPNARRGPVVQFLLQFNSPLIYVLLAAAAVTVAIGDLVDAAVILGVVLVNAVIGFIQERRAGEALEALAEFTRTQSTVVRDGQPELRDSRDRGARGRRPVGGWGEGPGGPSPDLGPRSCGSTSPR